MKKSAMLMLCLVLVFALAACAGTDTTPQRSVSDTVTVTDMLYPNKSVSDGSRYQFGMPFYASLEALIPASCKPIEDWGKESPIGSNLFATLQQLAFKSSYPPSSKNTKTVCCNSSISSV